MIVDTSALIAILRREPEADRFTDALLAAPEPKMSAGTLLEARMIAQRDNGAAELEVLIDTAGIEVVPTDLAQIDLAFEGFLRFGKGRHPAGLNLAICSLTRWLARWTSRCFTRAMISDKRICSWRDRAPPYATSDLSGVRIDKKAVDDTRVALNQNQPFGPDTLTPRGRS